MVDEEPPIYFGSHEKWSTRNAVVHSASRSWRCLFLVCFFLFIVFPFLFLFSLSLSLSLSFLFPRFKNVHVKETWLELVPRATETNNGGEHVMICRCAIRDYVIYALDQRRSNCSVFCSLPASRGIADFIYSFFIFLYIYIFFFFPLNIFFKYFDNE